VIRNKPHIWNPQTRRWLQDTTGLLSQIPGRTVTLPPTAGTTNNTASTGTNSTTSQQIQLAAANAERSLSLAMAGFRSAMQNLE
jgi:hypothetical protein